MAKCKITSGKLAGTEFEISEETLGNLKKVKKKVIWVGDFYAEKGENRAIHIGLFPYEPDDEHFNSVTTVNMNFTKLEVRKIIKGLQSLLED